MNTTPQTLNMAIYGMVAVLALIGFFLGLKRGGGKQLFRTLTVAASAAGSVFVTKMLYNVFYNTIAGKTPAEIVTTYNITVNEETMTVIENIDPATAEYVVPLILSFLILPFIFVLLFLLISAVAWVIFAIIAAIAGKKKPSGGSRMLGGLIGLIQGAAVAMILLVPIAGLLGFSERATAEMQKNDPDSESTQKTVEFYEENLKPINENFVVRATQKAGGNALFDYFATVEVEGKKTNMQDEAIAVVRIGARVSVMKDVKWSSLTESDKKNIEAIYADLTENPYLCGLSAGILRAASGYLGEQVLNSAEMEEPMKTIFTELVGSFREITSDTLAADLGTVKDVYFTLSDAGVLLAMNENGDITAALAAVDAEGNTVLSRVVSLLSGNEHLKQITTALTNVSFAILLDSVEMDEETMQKIEEVKGDVVNTLNDVLALDESAYETHEEYVSAVGDQINDALVAHEIELDAEIVDGIASYVADPANFTDENGVRKTEITEDDLVEFALSYFASVAETEETAD